MANFPLFPPSILAKGDTASWRPLFGLCDSGINGDRLQREGDLCRADVSPWNPHTPRPLELQLGQEWFGCVPGAPGMGVGRSQECA